nr:MAG TPA: hypothetical protein [Caudoviricetes sp.]
MLICAIKHKLFININHRLKKFFSILSQIYLTEIKKKYTIQHI